MSLEKGGRPGPERITSLVFVVANGRAEIAGSAGNKKDGGCRRPFSFKNALSAALSEGESGIGLHRAAVVGGCRNRGHAWIRDARCKSRRAELVIGRLKAWMV
jgi:hypothetical protein